MDVDTSAERVLPSENVKTIINPNLPSPKQFMEIDASVDHKKKSMYTQNLRISTISDH